MERDANTGTISINMMHFNSHAHVERDGEQISGAPQGFNFNSHAHVERDAFDIETSSFYDDFNSHAHVERDTQTKQNFKKL